jgi:hypothetical protein
VTIEARIGRLRAALRRGRRRLRQVASFDRRRRRAIARLRAKLGPKFGVDVAWGAPSIAALKDAGVQFICRYLSFDPSKNLTAAEVRAYHGAGIEVVCIWEGTALEAEQGTAIAAADAQRAIALARELGMPPGRPIYFAVDGEATLAEVRAYFAELSRVVPLNHYEVGAYGSVRLVRELFDAGLIRFGWQTYAWSLGQWEPRAQLRQYSNGHTIDGVGVDYDRSVDSDFGQW